MYFYHCVLYISYACLKCLWNSYKICISFLYSLIPIHSCPTVRTGIITVCHVITHLETMSSFYRGSEFFEKGGVIGTQSFITALSFSLAQKLWNFYWILIGWFQTGNVQVLYQNSLLGMYIKFYNLFLLFSERNKLPVNIQHHH